MARADSGGHESERNRVKLGMSNFEELPVSDCISATESSKSRLLSLEYQKSQRNDHENEADVSGQAELSEGGKNGSIVDSFNITKPGLQELLDAQITATDQLAKRQQTLMLMKGALMLADADTASTIGTSRKTHDLDL